MRTTTSLTALAVAALAVAGLAGCSSANNAAEPTATETVTTTTSPSAEPTSSTPATSSSSPSASPTSGAIAACTSAHLSASIGDGAGGAAGSVGVSLVLKNTGSASCTLQGWPGVSLVGGGTGTQIGAAATFDRSTPHGTVTLASGSTASAPLLYAQAGNYDKAKCQPTATDGFRVYPPGQKASIFAAYKGVTGCKSTSVKLLTVGALQ